MIKKDVTVPGVGVFSLCPSTVGVGITMHAYSQMDGMAPIEITWEEMLDVESLYEKCQEMKVKSFKPVVEALGVMYNNKTLYEALLQ